MPVTSISKHVYESVKLKFTAVTVSSIIYYWIIIYVNGIVHLKTILSLLNSCWYKPSDFLTLNIKEDFWSLTVWITYSFSFNWKKTAWTFCKTSLFELHVTTWGFWVNKPLKDLMKLLFVCFSLSAEVLWESRAFGERGEALRYHCFHPWRVPNQQKDCFNFRNTARQKPQISVEALWGSEWSGGEP